MLLNIWLSSLRNKFSASPKLRRRQLKQAVLFRAVEVCESRVLLSATSATASSDGTSASSVIEPDYAAMMSTYDTSAYTASGSLADQTATSYMGSMPDAGFGLDDFSGTAATDGTELGPIVGPYSSQIDGAAAGFTETAISTWQGTQQQTADPQPTTVATQGAGDMPSTSGNSGATDPWVSAFFGDGQTSATNSNVDASDVPEQQPGNGEDADAETADGDDNLPEPTISGGFTTTTTVNGDATTTTYTLTSSISLESGSMAGGDQNDDSRWQVPAEWTDKAGTIPKDSDESASEDSDADVTSVDEMDTAPTNESGVRFKASTTITASVTTSPLTTPDGNTGTTTSLTFSFTGSVVIMVSGSWSAGDEGNTGTVLTEDDISATQLSAGPQAPPSEAETSMTRAPRPLALGGNGTSVSASGEYFSYAFATMTFSVTMSRTTMDNGAPGGGLSVPSASLNLSLGSGSFSTDQSDITVQESSESDTSNNAKSVQVKEKNVSGSATNFTLNLGGDDDASDDDAASSDAASPSQSPAVLRDNDWSGGITAPDNSADAAADDGGPVSFSTVSHNSHQKTTLYATQSGQQSATSESSSSTKADIEDSSSGSTSLSFSISGFDYETTSKSKSEFSYLSESNASSDSPVGYDGRPSSHSESVSSHVIETLDESNRTFGFGVGSDGIDLTNEYSSNETVSDVLKSESTSGSWRLVYPTITSSLAMSADNPPPSPYWVAGPELKMTSGHDIQFNYGGNLEDGFEGSYSETAGFSMESLKQDGTVDHYEYILTVQETYPNTNEGDDLNAEESSADDSDIETAASSGTGGSNPTARFDKEGGTNANVPEGGTVVTATNGERYVYDADGKLVGMLNDNGSLYWPLAWPENINEFSTDERAVILMCGSDKAAVDAIIRLFTVIKKPRTIGANRCFSYMDQVMDDLHFPNEKGFMDWKRGSIRLQPQTWDPGRFVPTQPRRFFGWYGMTQHAVMKVHFIQTGQVAFFDIGSDTHLGQLGGDDHWFFSGASIIDAKTGLPVSVIIKGYLHGSEQNVD